MSYGHRIQTNFARGEISPDVLSRGDIDVFNSSLKLCRNFFPKFQGPATYANGTMYICDSSVASGSKLIPFVYRDTQSYQIELYVEGGSLKIRILNDDGVLQFSSGNVGWIKNAEYGVSCTFDFTGGAVEDMVVRVAHGLSDDDEIYFSEGVVGDLPAEVEPFKKYFVVNSGTNYFQISETLSGDVYEFTDDGSTGAKYHVYNDAFSDSEQIGFPVADGNDPDIMAACDTESAVTCTFDATGGAAENIVKKVAHGLTDGDMLYFANSGGALPAEVYQYKPYYVVNADTDYFQISETSGGDVYEFTDDGSATSSFYEYTFGSDVELELTGSFVASDLENVRFAQSGSAMVIVSEGKFCIQIWRGISSETAWALNQAKIENSSFKIITSISNDGDGYAQFNLSVAHGYVAGDIVIIKNTNRDENYDGAYKVTRVINAVSFTTGQEYIGYSETLGVTDKVRKGGTFYNFKFCFEEVTDFLTVTENIPKEVKFNEGRLYFAKEDKLYGSRSVVDGSDMYANFCQSIDSISTDAIDFLCAVSSEKVDIFKWLKVSNKTFYAGMENLVAVVHGEEGQDDPIGGDSIRMRSVESRGSSDVPPIDDGTDIIFVGSTGKTINAFKYNLSVDSERSEEQSILNENYFTSTVKRIVFQRGTPDKVWILLEDGSLIGFIYRATENISGWFKYEDANGDTYSDISVLPVSNGVDRLWVVVARPDEDGDLFDRIEQLEIGCQFFKKEDFYTTEDNKVEDTRRWKNAVYEQQKSAVHMHSMTYYNAFEDTESSGQYLHFNSDKDEIYTSLDGTASGKLTGSNSLLSGEVDNNIVIKATTGGLGEGKYSIDSYDSVTGIATITEKKELADYTYSTTETSYIIEPSYWGITLSSLTSSSFERYYESEGESIGVVIDGGYVDNLVIEKDGSDYTVDFGNHDGAVIYFGYVFTGILATVPIDVGGRLGTSFSRLKNMEQVRVDFIDSVNIKYGVDPYNLTPLDFRIGSDITDRPPPLFTGTVALENIKGGWDNKKVMYFIQDVPTPCTIACIDIDGNISDEA